MPAAPPALLVTSERDGLARCFWCGDDPLYVHYHDQEWGRPVKDDARLFEKLCLEGFQSGLSWLTILRKREGFRRAFRDFDLARVARFTETDVERLVADATIVRHRGKIDSAIGNAARALELRKEFGSLGAYFWRYEDRGPFPGIVSSTETSKRLSRELKGRGFTFVGPTTMYAFMQAMGLVNDHVPGCAFRAEVERERAAFETPAKP